MEVWILSGVWLAGVVWRFQLFSGGVGLVFMLVLCGWLVFRISSSRSDRAWAMDFQRSVSWQNWGWVSAWEKYVSLQIWQ